MYSPGESASNSQTRSLAALNSSTASTHAKVSSFKTLMMSKGLSSTERTSLGLELPQMVRVQSNWRGAGALSGKPLTSGHELS
jgi:hypothetical protein